MIKELGEGLVSQNFPANSIAVVLGSSGGIGSAVFDLLRRDKTFSKVIPASRSTKPKVDLKNEQSIKDLAEAVKSTEGDLRLVFDATGVLHSDHFFPEKILKSINTETLYENFMVNAIGPVLCLKYLAPLFPKQGKSVFVSLSARVGSISDNFLGGWYSYRASKTALNQLIKTASVELARSLPSHVSVLFHPGTVSTELSEPFTKSGLSLLTPEDSASKLWAAIKTLDSSDSGKFFDNEKRVIPW